MVEGYGRSYAALDTAYPSTMLRMVPLPVAGRTINVRFRSFSALVGRHGKGAANRFAAPGLAVRR
ncbi:alpha-mannosidase [Sphingopyxis sp. FD7]|nr:alpha-mannosidase [Sphingopyxis sp. FD7]